jgi:hypothetical protein
MERGTVLVRPIAEIEGMFPMCRGILVCVLFLALTSCRSTKSELAHVGESIPSSSCRVIATVVSIDQASRSPNPTDPCSKAPCRASLRIGQVLGYGVAFPVALTEGEIISVNFAFTTAPTQDAIPHMTESLPGVQIGSTLEANLVSVETLKDGSGDSRVYVIYRYSLK